MGTPLASDPNTRSTLEEAQKRLEENEITASMMEAFEEFARETSVDETDERFRIFCIMDQLSARELEAYVEKKRAQFSRLSKEENPQRWRIQGSILTAGYTKLARMDRVKRR